VIGDEPENTIKGQAPSETAVSRGEGETLTAQMPRAVSKGPGSSENACEDKGSGQFAFCAIDRPERGPWTIVLKRTRGEGQVQVTTLLVRK